MTLCVVTKGHCVCQPNEGAFCPDYKPDAYVQYLMDAITELRQTLDERPRTEFIAVGWWDGKQALYEPGMQPERGALLFRPLPQDDQR